MKLEKYRCGLLYNR